MSTDSAKLKVALAEAITHTLWGNGTITAQEKETLDELNRKTFQDGKC